MHELVPGFKGEPGLDSQPVGQFLFQNGFVAVDEAQLCSGHPPTKIILVLFQMEWRQMKLSCDSRSKRHCSAE